jgi:NADH-quinone oxidoreductase subunit G
MRPRPNDDVNKFFLCDEGRLDYRWLERRDRVELPYVRQNGALVPVDWEDAFRAAAALLTGRRAHVLASPMLPNEALYLLRRLVDRTGGAGSYTVRTGPEAPLPGVPDLALRADRAANVTGAELFGFARSDDPLGGLTAGDVLVVADEELAGRAVSLPAGVAVIVVGTTQPAWAASADVVLPITNVAEEDGTFTNLRGRVQRYTQAKAAPGLARPSWYVLGDLLAAMGDGGGFFNARDAFAALAAAHPSFAGLSYDSLGLRGQPVADAERFAASAELAGVA